jgi:excisionase family DNA binding protein
MSISEVAVIETPPQFTREDLLTADEVARALRVKRTTALGYMRRGVIPACKIGKHWYSPRPLLDEYLASLFREGGD